MLVTQQGSITELSGLIRQHKENKDVKEGKKDGRKVIKKDKDEKKDREPKKCQKIHLKYSVKGREAW